MRIRWEDGSEISTAVSGDEVTISANGQGMISLANILLTLAKDTPGAHVHLDEHNALEDGSVELIFEKVE